MARKSIISQPVEISLRLLGAWPNSPYRILKCVIWTTTMTTFLVFQYWYCINHVNTDDYGDLLDSLSIALSNTLVLFKFIIIWSHNRIFSETVVIMEEDWDDCKSGWNMDIMIHKATLSSRIARLMLIVFTGTIVTYAIVLFLVFDEDSDSEESHADDKKFLLKMQLPFEATASPLYEIILIVQIVIEMIIAIMSGMSMALIATLALHVAGQIEVVCKKLTEAVNHYNGKEPCISIIKEVIVKHQRIIYMSDNIEDVFTFISLMQFFFNILAMCFISFIIVVSLENGTASTVIPKYLSYYIAIHFEAFILCYAGEYLSSKSQNISWVAFNCNWYNLSIPEIRILLLLILRSQRPLTLTAGKITTLSLETFANMLKASASYVSILYAMV